MINAKSKEGSTCRTILRTLQMLTITLIFASAFVHQALGQSESGKVVGTVTDQTGATVSGATLTLTNNENGLALTAISNGAGELNLPAVPRGVYTAKISAPGFQSQSQSITVTVTEVQGLQFKLTRGGVTHSIEAKVQ